MAYIKNPRQALLYLKFRPSPPEKLLFTTLDFLNEKISVPLGCVLDVGCGSGQSTVILAPYFKHVIGIDNCKEQLQEARNNSSYKNVTFRSGIAEKLEEIDGSVDLVTTGMAIHWFDLKRFNAEVERVLRPNGALAVYGYTFPRAIAGNVCLTELVLMMFNGPLGKYVPDESKLVYFDAYKGVEFSEFPFSKEPAHRFEFDKKIENATVRDLMGYISSTSSFQNYILDHGDGEATKLLSSFKTQVAECLGERTCIEDVSLDLTFPYFLLLSRKNRK